MQPLLTVGGTAPQTTRTINGENNNDDWADVIVEEIHDIHNTSKLSNINVEEKSVNLS